LSFVSNKIIFIIFNVFYAKLILRIYISFRINSQIKQIIKKREKLKQITSKG